MSLTKIGSIGINTGIAFAGVTTIVTLNTANDALSIGATVNVGSGITLGASGDIFATGVSTVTTLKVGSGVTVSSDGDIFATGVCTATSFSGSGANLTGIDTDLVSDTSPQLGGNLDVNTKNIVFGDSGGATDDRLTFGAGTDLSIYHNGSDSYIEDSGTGALVVKTSQLSIRNAADDEQLAKFVQDSSVELYHNNSKKFETTTDGIEVSGAIFASGKLDVPDNAKLMLGTGDDLQIYHDGSNSYILNDTNNLIIKDLTDAVYIQAPSIIFNDETTNENIARFISDGAVELYHDNVKKFETHDIGTIFTEAGSGTSQAAIKVNTTLDTYGVVTVRDRRDVDNAVAAFQVENASNGTNETNLLIRSVNLGTTAFSHGIYAAKSHRFGVSSNTTPTVQIDSDGLKFNNDQAAANALDDYEHGTHNPTDASGASITLTYNNSGRYVKIGRFVNVQFDITYASNSDGNLASITPPFTNSLNYGQGVVGWNEVGKPMQLHVSSGNVYLMDNDNASGNNKHMTNSEVSGKRIIGMYTMQINE